MLKTKASTAIHPIKKAAATPRLLAGMTAD